MGSLNFHANVTKSNNVFVVLSGNFTTVQRKIIKERCTINVSNFKAIHGWLRRKNPHYKFFSRFHECPCPIVLEDDNSIDKESEKPKIE
jgi:hypothetical protein